MPLHCIHRIDKVVNLSFTYILSRLLKNHPKFLRLNNIGQKSLALHPEKSQGNTFMFFKRYLKKRESKSNPGKVLAQIFGLVLRLANKCIEKDEETEISPPDKPV